MGACCGEVFPYVHGCGRRRSGHRLVPLVYPQVLLGVARHTLCTVLVLVARGQARVSVSASAADWPKRIRGMQYVDHDDFAAAHWGPP